MVTLNFNVYGYNLQRGVEILRDSFSAAANALEDRLKTAGDARERHAAYVESGGDWIGEEDDDGIVLWDYGDIKEFEIQTARDMIFALNRAFVLAAYHHWEQCARKWTGRTTGNFDLLVRNIESNDYPTHDRMTVVNRLANLLKHGNPNLGPQLLTDWPDIVDVERLRAGAQDDWADAIRLSRDHVLEVLRIVAASGPLATHLPWADQATSWPN